MMHDHAPPPPARSPQPGDRVYGIDMGHGGSAPYCGLVVDASGTIVQAAAMLRHHIGQPARPVLQDVIARHCRVDTLDAAGQRVRVTRHDLERLPGATPHPPSAQTPPAPAAHPPPAPPGDPGDVDATQLPLF